jgi:hypothetical protein
VGVATRDRSHQLRYTTGNDATWRVVVLVARTFRVRVGLKSRSREPGPLMATLVASGHYKVPATKWFRARVGIGKLAASVVDRGD